MDNTTIAAMVLMGGATLITTSTIFYFHSKKLKSNFDASIKSLSKSHLKDQENLQEKLDKSDQKNKDDQAEYKKDLKQKIIQHQKDLDSTRKDAQDAAGKQVKDTTDRCSEKLKKKDLELSK